MPFDFDHLTEETEFDIKVLSSRKSLIIISSSKGEMRLHFSTDTKVSLCLWVGWRGSRAAFDLNSLANSSSKSLLEDIPGFHLSIPEKRIFKSKTTHYTKIPVSYPGPIIMTQWAKVPATKHTHLSSIPSMTHMIEELTSKSCLLTSTCEL